MRLKGGLGRLVTDRRCLILVPQWVRHKGCGEAVDLVFVNVSGAVVFHQLCESTHCLFIA